MKIYCEHCGDSIRLGAAGWHHSSTRTVGCPHRVGFTAEPSLQDCVAFAEMVARGNAEGVR